MPWAKCYMQPTLHVYPRNFLVTWITKDLRVVLTSTIPGCACFAWKHGVTAANAIQDLLRVNNDVGAGRNGEMAHEHAMKGCGCHLWRGLHMTLNWTSRDHTRTDVKLLEGYCHNGVGEHPDKDDEFIVGMPWYRGKLTRSHIRFVVYRGCFWHVRM